MKFINSDKTIKISRNGIVKDYDVLFTFNSPSNNRLYIGYTDDSVGINGRKNIYVSSYDEKSKDNNYYPITDIDELKIINEVLQSIDMEVQGGNLWVKSQIRIMMSN